mmetsp:Transcript_57534/g.91498  ORF Transcript_57534/g.91498 Transcript_57534/m.91498 type:complete len:138 (+) Transcript_57534:28-441(+)
MATQYCMKCGYSLPSSARFCSSCGTQQPPGQNASAPLLKNNAVGVQKQYQVQPHAVKNCSFKDCGTVSTATCDDCDQWSCQAHLRTIAGYCHYCNNGMVTVCPDCKSKRNKNKRDAIVLIILLIVAIGVVVGLVVSE